MFKNRTDSGKQLAELLTKYKDNDNVVVIGLARGGVVTAFAVAKALAIPLGVHCPRKLGAPSNPELALGAVTDTGALFLNKELIRSLNVPQQFLDEEIAKQIKIAKERTKYFRKSRPPIELENKIVLLVDDGIATGATMKAAITDARQQNAKKCVVAIPVAPKESLLELAEMADEVVCVISPTSFQAVGQFYVDFRQIETEEVASLLDHFLQT